MDSDSQLRPYIKYYINSSVFNNKISHQKCPKNSVGRRNLRFQNGTENKGFVIKTSQNTKKLSEFCFKRPRSQLLRPAAARRQ
jgi:hypothetical protein